MALNPTPVGDSIAAAVQAAAPAPGSAITSSQLKSLWETIVGIIYTDLKTNAQVMPGTFESPPGVTGGPVTGIGGPLE